MQLSKKIPGYIYIATLFFTMSLSAQNFKYFWLNGNSIENSSRVVSIELPEGFIRVPLEQNSFQNWLRNLPLKKTGTAVRLYNGQLKTDQSVHFRVIHIDVGKLNLQQCADAIIRLRAEYLYEMDQSNSISFNFTSGHAAEYKQWIHGFRPRINGNDVKWENLSGVDSTYTGFRKYLNTVFTYAGSYSLKKELIPVNHVNNICGGDMFIQGAFPGHGIIVLDKAENGLTGKIAILLAQSYMPAQDIHILKNPGNPELSPWYIVGKGERLITPEWIFEWKDLRRFK